MPAPADLHAPTIRDGKPRDPPADGLPPGRELAGRYRILELAGQGGTGFVYRARDLALDIDVALKLLHPAIAHDPAKIAFFRNEVRVARMVTHPNVCRLHDLEDGRDGCFITMEYIAGEPLSARLDRGPVELPAALRILRDVASGLAAAHAAGVVHRDLKPSNILLAGARAIVVDFGIAGERAALAAGPQDIAGTRGYMAPEQATGAAVDARADVYALGVLAYVLVTGHRPPLLVTHTAPAAASAVPSPIGDLDRALAALPPELTALIADCLAVSPDDRPRDASALLDRLDAIVERRKLLARLAGGHDALAPALAGRSPHAEHDLRAPAPAASSPYEGHHSPAPVLAARSSRDGRRAIGSRRRARRWIAGALLAMAIGAIAALVARGRAPTTAAPPSRIVVAEIDAGALPASDRWQAGAVQRLIADELVEAWGLEVDLASSAEPLPDALVLAGRLARAPSGRLRLAIAGDRFEARSARDLAVGVAARIVADHVPPALRHPTALELAAVGARDPEAWRLWRRAQHETLLMRWERATAMCIEARARDPAFPLPALELALAYDNQDVAATPQLADAVQLMARVPVRPLWPLAATGARQLIDGDLAGATRTFEQARRLELTPRERLWLELRWAMAGYFNDSPQSVAPVLELMAETRPDHASAFKLLAGMHLGSDQPTAPTLALRYAARAVELAPDDGGARAELATALLLAGRRDEARARAAELAQLDPEDKRLARGRLFTLHMALGDLAEAELDARRQLSGSPGQRAEGASEIALIDLYRGRFDAGVRGLLASAQAYDAIGLTVSAARQRSLAGRQAWLVGDRAAAVAALEQVAAGPTHYAPVAHVLAAIAAGKLDVAHARATALPEDSIERASVELAIADAVHDPSRVLAAFARVEKLSAAIDQLLAVAEALERTDRLDEAAAMFERLATSPRAWIEPIASTRALHRLGRLRERAGDPASARQAYSELLRRWGNATARTAEVDDARRRLRALGGR